MKDISIFLARSNNDLDHLTAILYKDFLDKKEKCLIIIISNEELELNPRLVYLKKIGFQVINFYSWLDAKGIIYNSSLFLNKKLNIFSRIYHLFGKIIGKLPFVNKPCRYILNKLYNFAVTKYSLSYDKSLYIAKSFLSNYVNIDNIKNLFFDIEQRAVYPQVQFCEIARQINAKIIMYNHAVINYDNDLVYNTHLTKKSVSVEYQLPTDIVVVYDEISKQRLSKELEGAGKTVYNIGSYRFSREYISLLQNEFKSQIDELNGILPKNKLKILLLIHKPIANYFLEEIYRIINTILMIDNVHLTIQMHTRGWAKDIANLLRKNASLNGALIVDNDKYSTSSLFATTDLILFTSTSVIYEAIILDKPVLHLSRTTSNRNYIDNLIKTYSISTRDDLIDEIEKAKGNKNYRSYTEAERDTVLKFLSQKDISLAELV